MSELFCEAQGADGSLVWNAHSPVDSSSHPILCEGPLLGDVDAPLLHLAAGSNHFTKMKLPQAQVDDLPDGWALRPDLYPALMRLLVKFPNPAIKHDLPPTPNGIIETWTTIVDLVARQKADPSYAAPIALPSRPSLPPAGTTKDKGA